MSTENADRNLLFGVFAVQLDFIDRDQLAAAMSAWALDKSKPLGDLLIERGQLSEADRSVLESLIDSHLQRHDDSVESSLASLQDSATRISDFPAELLESDDDEIRTCAQSMVNYTTPGEPTLTEHDMTDEPSVAASTSSGQRFIVLRPHAKGGLGCVLVARDRELARNVALKEIQEKFADDQVSQQQFLLEAEITGSLEHPGVVPVYALGRYANGRPYYAMRFIEGESLRSAVDRYQKSKARASERRIELRKLLNHFVDVCNVIEYAYSRGILHRDLKPDNIMLGAYGETLVVDWGLAVRIEPDATNCSSRPVGTPAYMSPEQADARRNSLTIASDIYCLGATLYFVLTGSAPLTDRNFGAVLEKARQGDFRRPREVKRETPRELEAICLKAMSLAPEDRYSSPAALANEIELWLADEPVTAYREPLWQRTWRWCRRHRTLASAAAVLLVTAAAALSVGLVVVKREQLRTERQRQEAVAARQQADQSAAAALAAQELAEAEARRADRQSALALSALKSMVFDLQTKLQDVPAAHRVRRDLLTTAIDRLRQVAGNLETDAEANHSLIWAHLDLGDIFLKAGSLDGDWTRQALALYQRGHEIAKQLHQAHSAPQTQRDLALTHDKLGDVELALGDASAAAAHYRSGLEINQQRQAAAPDDLQAARDLAVSHNNLGDVQRRLGNVSAARDDYQISLEITQKLAADDPGDPVVRRNLAVSYDRLGSVNTELGDLPAAREAYLKCLEINRERAELQPDHVKTRIDLAVAHHHVGDAAMQLGEVASALEFYRNSLQVCSALATADPENSEAQRMLAASHQRLGNAYMQQADWEQARFQFEKCQEISLASASADPANTVAQRDLSVAYEKLGDVHLVLNDLDAALDKYQKMFAIVERLSLANPQDVLAREDLAAAYSKLGEVYDLEGQVASARAAHRNALDLSRQQAEADPANLQAQAALAAAYGRLGFLEARDFQFAVAAQLFDKGSEILAGLEAAKKLVDHPLYLDWLTEQRQMAQFCNDALHAVNNPQAAEGAPPAEAARILGLRMAVRLRAGEATAAVEAASALGELARSQVDVEGSNVSPAALAIQAAQGFAAAAALLRGEQPASELVPAKQAEHQACVECVVRWLAFAQEQNGLNLAEQEILLQDPAIQSLLEDPNLAKLLPAKQP